MIMMTIMLLDVLQEQDVVQDGTHAVRCFGSVKMFS
jgi:hypothetical protein